MLQLVVLVKCTVVEIQSWICCLYLSVTAHQLVSASLSLRCTLYTAGTFKNQETKKCAEYIAYCIVQHMYISYLLSHPASCKCIVQHMYNSYLLSYPALGECIVQHMYISYLLSYPVSGECIVQHMYNSYLLCYPASCECIVTHVYFIPTLLSCIM